MRQAIIYAAVLGLGFFLAWGVMLMLVLTTPEVP